MMKHNVVKIIVNGNVVVDRTVSAAQAQPTTLVTPSKGPQVSSSFKGPSMGPPSKGPQVSSSSSSSSSKITTKKKNQQKRLSVKAVVLLNDKLSAGFLLSKVTQLNQAVMTQQGLLKENFEIDDDNSLEVLWLNLQAEIYGNLLVDDTNDNFQRQANNRLQYGFIAYVNDSKTSKKLTPTAFSNTQGPTDRSSLLGLLANPIVLVGKKNPVSSKPSDVINLADTEDDDDDVKVVDVKRERPRSNHDDDDDDDDEDDVGANVKRERLRDDDDNEDYRPLYEPRSVQSLADEKRGRNLRQNEEQEARIKLYREQKDENDRKKKEEQDRAGDMKEFEQWKKSKKDDEEKKSNDLHSLLNEVTKKDDGNDDADDTA
jgi:hypothetical protein